MRPKFSFEKKSEFFLKFGKISHCDFERIYPGGDRVSSCLSIQSKQSLYKNDVYFSTTFILAGRD